MAAFTPTRSQLRNGSNIAKTFGNITYDENAIRGKFDAASNAQYNTLNKEYQTTENKYYDNLANTGTTALDIIRKANAKAIATGGSRGMQSANELSSVLGLEQTGVADATLLAQQRNLLKDKEAQAYADNAVNALKYANETKFGLGNLSANLYASDTQFDVGQMDYYARLDAAQKGLEGQQAIAGAQRYSADQNLAGTKYNANANYEGTKYNADKNYASNTDVANINSKASGYAADKNLAGQQALADAQKAYYNMMGKSYSGGGGSYYGAGSNQAQTPADIINGALASGDQATFLAIMAQSGVPTDVAQKLFEQKRAEQAAATNAKISAMAFNQDPWSDAGIKTGSAAGSLRVNRTNPTASYRK